MTATTRIRRDVLLRKAKQGKLLARTEMSISDDSRYDVMPDAERPFLPVVLERDQFAHMKTCLLHEFDFKSKSGYAAKQEDGTITLCVHSNLYIQLKEAA